VNLSVEEEDELSGEDQLVSLEEVSPSSDQAYVSGSLNSIPGDSRSNAMSTSQGFHGLHNMGMSMNMAQQTTVNATGIM
jgi:transcription factor STE12